MEDSPINQWIRINKKLKIFEFLSLGLVLANLLLGAGIWYAISRKTILIQEKMAERKYFSIESDDYPPTKDDVIAVVRDFISRRFNYQKTNFDEVFSSLAPICTEGFMDEVDSALTKEEMEFSMVKSMEVTPVNIHPIVTDKEAKAKFDKLVKLDGVPLIISSEIQLSLIPVNRTPENPYGLAVDGVSEREIR